VTRHSGPSDHDQAAQRWLTQHQHALTHALDDVLDTEAGLREILLHSHHDTATGNLDTVLDTEAGLAAILPAPPTSPADTHDTPPHHTDTTELLRALSPADRMTLRSNPDVKTASHARDRARDRAREHALDRYRDLVLDRDLDLVRDLADALDRDLNRVRDLFLDLNRDLDRALADALDRDLVHDLDLVRALDLVRILDRALDLVRALDRYRDLDRTLVHALARARDLTRVLDLLRDLTNPGAVGRVLNLIVEVRTAEVGRAMGLVLRREPLLLDKDSLHALLDDFTATDLSNADLTGIDLSGVHWSEHTTQWPPAIDIENLKTRSNETPPGSGTWIVRSGTATIRNLAER
jgi:hypothetical protein